MGHREQEYPPEMRERALQIRAELRPEHPTLIGAILQVASMLDISPQTLRLWERSFEVDHLSFPLGCSVLSATQSFVRGKSVELAMNEVFGGRHPVQPFHLRWPGKPDHPGLTPHNGDEPLAHGVRLQPG